MIPGTMTSRTWERILGGEEAAGVRVVGDAVLKVQFIDDQRNFSVFSIGISSRPYNGPLGLAPD
jgi:hypothetical protein